MSRLRVATIVVVALKHLWIVARKYYPVEVNNERFLGEHLTLKEITAFDVFNNFGKGIIAILFESCS